MCVQVRTKPRRKSAKVPSEATAAKRARLSAWKADMEDYVFMRNILIKALSRASRYKYVFNLSVDGLSLHWIVYIACCGSLYWWEVLSPIRFRSAITIRNLEMQYRMLERERWPMVRNSVLSKYLAAGGELPSDWLDGLPQHGC